MCSFYTKLDIKQLPLSNPFLDDTSPTPVEVELPSNIVVESPESGVHTAWTNVRRFPSLHQQHIYTDSQTSQQSTPRSISIHGPKEMSKQGQFSYVPYNPQQQAKKNALRQADTFVSSQRKLQRHSRIDSFPEAMSEKAASGKSSQNSTPGSLSPVSADDYEDDDEDEFSYLPSTPKVVRVFSPQIVSVKQPFKHAVTSDVSLPEPLRIRRKEQGPAQWMNEVCQNL